MRQTDKHYIDELKRLQVRMDELIGALERRYKREYDEVIKKVVDENGNIRRFSENNSVVDSPGSVQRDSK